MQCSSMGRVVRRGSRAVWGATLTNSNFAMAPGKFPLDGTRESCGPQVQHNARRQTQPEPILTDTYKAEVTYPAIEPPAGLKGLKINRVIATNMDPDNCGMARKTS